MKVPQSQVTGGQPGPKGDTDQVGSRAGPAVRGTCQRSSGAATFEGSSGA